MVKILRKTLVLFSLISGFLLLTGCVSDPLLVAESLQLMSDFAQQTPPHIEKLDAMGDSSNGSEQSSTATDQTSTTETSPGTSSNNAQAASTTTVTVKNSRVNIRSGPGLEHQPIQTVSTGTVFTTSGSTSNGWWRICCFQGVNEDPDQPTLPAWVSGRVVEASADAVALPILETLFPPNVSAVWDVDYQCGSDRCVERVCTAEMIATERDDLDSFWLIIDREVIWANDCGENTTLRHQLDRFDGKDLYTGQTEVFLVDYWHGADSGPTNSIFTLSDDRKVAAWCDNQLTDEVPQENGWVNTYVGAACYDVRTGILLSMNYIKRWFYSGEFEGEIYDRAYLGDFEVYEITLNRTNIELLYEK